MKKLVLSVMGLFAAVTLVACSSGGSADGGQSATAENQTIFEGVYQHMQVAQNELWYRVSTNDNVVDKNDDIRAVLVINNGESIAYALPKGISIGSLSKMSDDEIFGKLLSWQEESKQQMLDSLNSELTTTTREYESLLASGEDESAFDFEDENPYVSLPNNIKKLKSKIELIESELEIIPLRTAFLLV